MIPLAIILLTISANFITTTKADTKTLFCYWGSWSTYRSFDGELNPNMMDPNACTHLVYAFATLNQRNQIDSIDAWNDLPPHEAGGGKDNYRKLVSLKRINPNLKVLISIGGWNEGSVKFSRLAGNEYVRRGFVSSVVGFLARYGFDGLDFAWQWPNQRGGSHLDKRNYVILLKELQDAFKARNYLLTIAAPAAYHDGGYDLTAIMNHVDFVSVYAYDYFVGDFTLQHGSPLVHPQNPLNCISYSIKAYLSHGGRPEKLLLGVTLYGRAYRLFNAQQTKIGDPNSGVADPGPYTQTPGLLAWFELCSKLKNEGFTEVNDSTYNVTYAYNSVEWIGYENPYSLKQKISYAKANNLAGLTIWSLDNDDNHRLCGEPLTVSASQSL